MYHTKALIPRSFEPQIDTKVSRNNLGNHDYSTYSYNQLNTRSRSNHNLKIPIKPSLAAINQSMRFGDLSTNEHLQNNTSQEFVLKTDNRDARKDAPDILTRRDSHNRSRMSVTPEKGDSALISAKRGLFKTPDISQSKIKMIDAPSESANQLASHENETFFKAKFPNNNLIRHLSNVPVKPFVFNQGIFMKQNTESGSRQELPSFRSRKEQFTMQNSSDSSSLLKRSKGASGFEDTEFVPSKQLPFNPREDQRSGLLENRKSDLSRNSSEVRLPKLEQQTSQKKLETDVGSTVSNITFNVSIGNVNIINNKKNEPDSSKLESAKRPPRDKIRSLDKSEIARMRPAPSSNHIDPTQILNQPQILFRKKPSNAGLVDTSLKVIGNESIDRTSTPLKERNLISNASKVRLMALPVVEPTDTKVVQTYAFKSRAGALPNKPIKTNQDSYIVHTNFAGQKDKFFFGVSDGHGVNGHLASGYIKQHLPKNIENAYKTVQKEDFNSMKELLTTSFLKTNRDLNASHIDTHFSGSTTVSCLIFNTKLWCANVGDSRAIVVKFKDNQWFAHALSRDHKPDAAIEKDRILSSGGRVDSFRDAYGEPLGPARVWLRDENIPGLAMARSFGDQVAARVGVIAEPEVTPFDLEEEDKFIVIASDGVWEFLSNEQVMNYIIPFYVRNQLDAACDKVVKESTDRWRQEDEVVDDITCIIITLKVPPRQATHIDEAKGL